MFYTIYQTTNTINNKKYIGKHVTENPYDDYIGSGLVLANAIKKYGRDAFAKEVLFIFDNEEEMNAKEIELITPEVVMSEEYYNIALGGKGGAIVLKEGHPLYEATRRKLSEAQQRRRDDISRITKENHKTRRVGMYGKKQSDYQKQRARDAQLGRSKSPEAVSKQREAMMQTFADPSYVHPNKGIKRSAEQVEQMRQRCLQDPKQQCPHCGVIMDKRNYARYHGNRCKKAPQ